MSYTFYLPKIETRSAENNGIREYIIRGYATVPNHVYSYKYEADKDGNIKKNFREFFTDNAIKNIVRKTKKSHTFVDVGHKIGATLNVGSILDNIQMRTNHDISKEKEYILSTIKNSEIPMFKVEELEFKEDGLFVDIRANPFYKTYSAEHEKQFESIWGSLESGFINGMSLNFKPTEFVKVNENLTQINDADVFGITLHSGVANDMANITEVAMRCIERGEEQCQMNRKTATLML